MPSETGMEKAGIVIFTRHELLDKQKKDMMKEFKEMDVKILDMTKEASVTMTTEEEVIEVFKKIKKFAKEIGVVEISVFGVIPVIMRFMMFTRDIIDFTEPMDTEVTIFEAMSFARAREGEKPVFEFGGFVVTGRFMI